MTTPQTTRGNGAQRHRVAPPPRARRVAAVLEQSLDEAREAGARLAVRARRSGRAASRGMRAHPLRSAAIGLAGLGVVYAMLAMMRRR